MGRKKNKKENEALLFSSSQALPESWKEEFTAQFFRQEQLYEKLLGLAREKRRVLLAGPVGLEQTMSLEAILKEEISLMAEARVLEEARPALYKRLVRESEGVEGDISSFDSELVRLSADCLSNMFPDLADRYARLHAVLEELKRLNRENGEILERFQRYVDFSLNLLEEKMGGGIYQEVEGKKVAVKKVVSVNGRVNREV